MQELSGKIRRQTSDHGQRPIWNQAYQVQEQVAERLFRPVGDQVRLQVWEHVQEQVRVQVQQHAMEAVDEATR
jgi:hypothetical protein